MWGSVIALVLEGFKLEDSCVIRGMEAIERLAAKDAGGKRIQATVSPVLDTVLMGIGLCDSGIFGGDKRLQKAIDWVKPSQLLSPEGDWRLYKPPVSPGGWSFEYFNTWYPDVGDTARAVMCLINTTPHLLVHFQSTGLQNGSSECRIWTALGRRLITITTRWS
jgi:squalene-hopene/tetraprenyl-beta-curcumene cyclase